MSHNNRFIVQSTFSKMTHITDLPQEVLLFAMR